MAVIAKVAVQAAPYAIDKVYDYLLPRDVGGQVGCRVLVPFGRGNRLSEAVILATGEGVPDKPLKTVRTLLDAEPVMSEKEIRLALWMRQRYFCTFYDALHTILPAAVWYRYREMWRLARDVLPETLPEKEAAVCRLLLDGPMETEALKQALGDDTALLLRRMEKTGMLCRETESRRKVRDKVDVFAKLAVPVEQALELVGKTARRQREVVAFLAQNGETGMHDLCYFTGASRKTVELLALNGTVSLREQEAYRITEKLYAVKAEAITLNDEQQQVYADILQQALSGKAGVTLLQGVTGSGKTLVYIRLAQELLHRGKSVMILVPEIALTPQMMARFTAYFGDEVALLHSGLRLTERYDQFKRIRRGEAHIVLGTRSAVFAPLRDIGLIVMDEEQEGSYESETSPCYHARDIAKYRCLQEGARLLLGSATPTVETAYWAEKGDYQKALLRQRYNRQALPQVIIADLRQELREGRNGIISWPLYEELQKNLTAGEQSILFLNRRGSSRQLLCPQCTYVPKCPRCSVYLTYHSANGRLMCHYCGYSEKAPEVCPECGGQFKHIGVGTQRVEEELHRIFPGTALLMMGGLFVLGIGIGALTEIIVGSMQKKGKMMNIGADRSRDDNYEIHSCDCGHHHDGEKHSHHGEDDHEYVDCCHHHNEDSHDDEKCGHHHKEGEEHGNHAHNLRHFLKEHVWKHVIKRHLPTIFAWTFGVLALFGILSIYIDIETWIKGNIWLMLVIAVAAGLIPESGPHLVFVSMFAAGILPFPVLLANCISQDGHACLPLIAENKRSWLTVKLIKTVIAAAVGAIAILIYL